MASNQPTSIALHRSHSLDDAQPANSFRWPLAFLLVIVHVAAMGVAGYAWYDGYRFGRALFACALTSIAIQGYACFTPQASRRSVINRLGLAAVLLGCAIAAPILKHWRIEPGPLIWLATGVQAARALWLAPFGAPRLSTKGLLVALALLGVWMYATPRVVRNSQQHQVEHLFANMAMAGAVIVLAARRSGWLAGVLFGGAAGSLLVVVTAAAWWDYLRFTMGIDTVKYTLLAAGTGALTGLLGRVERRMLGPSVDLRRVDLDHKASAAVRRLAQTLHWRGALVLNQLPGNKMAGELDDAKAVPVLIDALSSSDLHVRFSAADVLGRIGPAATPAISALWRLVGSDPQPGDRPGEALARMGSEGIAALIELFHSDNPEQRAGAAQSLRLAGPNLAAAEALAQALDDAHTTVRQQAAASLGELGIANEAIVAALEKAQFDPVLPVRYAARRSLARLGSTARSASALG